MGFAPSIRAAASLQMRCVVEAVDPEVRLDQPVLAVQGPALLVYAEVEHPRVVHSRAPGAIGPQQHGKDVLQDAAVGNHDHRIAVVVAALRAHGEAHAGVKLPARRRRPMEGTRNRMLMAAILSLVLLPVGRNLQEKLPPSQPLIALGDGRPYRTLDLPTLIVRHFSKKARAFSTAACDIRRCSFETTRFLYSGPKWVTCLRGSCSALSTFPVTGDRGLRVRRWKCSALSTTGREPMHP